MDVSACCMKSTSSISDNHGGNGTLLPWSCTSWKTHPKLYWCEPFQSAVKRRDATSPPNQMNKCNIGNLVKQIETGSPCLHSSLSFYCVVFSANCSIAAVFRGLQSLETHNFRSHSTLRSFNTVLGGETVGSVNSCQASLLPIPQKAGSQQRLVAVPSEIGVLGLYSMTRIPEMKKKLEELLQISYKLSSSYIGSVYASIILLIATRCTGVGCVQQKTGEVLCVTNWNCTDSSLGILYF